MGKTGVTLDLNQASKELAQMTDALVASERERRARLASARELWAALRADHTAVLRRAQAPEARITWLLGIPGGPVRTIGAAPAPPRYTVVAVDGSQIELERQATASYFLINTGWSVLSYGTGERATLASSCRVYYRPDELFVALGNGRRVPVRDELLGALRAEAELERLADLLATTPGDRPALGLVDGNLTAWPLAGLEDELQERFLERRMAMCETMRARGHLFAGYISASQATEGVNLLRVMLCPDDPIRCDQCSTRLATGREACEPVDGVVDAEVVAAALPPGARTTLFRSTSRILGRYPPEQRTWFFYLNAGGETARIEVPEWIARDDGRVDLVHRLIADQCERGRGYPPSLVEAHEQAVVGDADRAVFSRLVEARLAEAGFHIRASAKQQSKLRRAV